LVLIQGCLEQERWERDGKQRSCISISIRKIQPLWPGHNHRHDQSAEGVAYVGDGEAACDTGMRSIPKTPFEEVDSKELCDE
jgi:single-stranded DNA-binding protein